MTWFLNCDHFIHKSSQKSPGSQYLKISCILNHPSSLIIDINLPSIIGNIIEKKYEKKCLNETWLSKMRLDMITILIFYMFKRACPKILVDFYTSQNQLKNYLYISCFNDLKTQTIFSVKNKRMKMLMAFQRGTRCWYG